MTFRAPPWPALPCLPRTRAQTVKDFLASRGVDAGRISAQGVGEMQPVANNDTGDGWARNRRVYIRISGNGYQR